MGDWQLPKMARPKRSMKLSGSQFADPFILPKGRIVIRGFDAEDGDFIAVPSDAKFKLLKSKGGVLIKGTGFRTMVKGATVAEVEEAFEESTPLTTWNDYTTGDVTVSASNGWLTFDADAGGSVVDVPESMYKGWRQIQIRGPVSFPGEGMTLDNESSSVSILHYHKLGDIKSMAEGGKMLFTFESHFQRPLKGALIQKILKF